MDTPDEAETVRDVETIERQLAATWTAGDCDAWSALLAPDWRVTHVNGAVIGRDEAIAMCRAPAVRVASVRYDDLHVRPFGNAAVVTGQTTAVTATDPPQTVVLRFTDVFIRRDGVWKVVTSHATRVEGA